MECMVCGETEDICLCKKKGNRMFFCGLHMPDKREFDFVYKMF